MPLNQTNFSVSASATSFNNIRNKFFWNSKKLSKNSKSPWNIMIPNVSVNAMNWSVNAMNWS